MSRLLCESHADTNNDENMESVKKSPTGLTNKPEGRVLVLYTGGTIGMVRNEQGGKYQYIIVKFRKIIITFKKDKIYFIESQIKSHTHTL